MRVRKLKQRFYRKTGGPRGWGNRYKDCGPGCLLCEMYRFLDDHGRFPNEAERDYYIAEAKAKEEMFAQAMRNIASEAPQS